MIASKETREKPNIHQLCLKKYKKTQEKKVCTIIRNCSKDSGMAVDKRLFLSYMF
jgi:hypothetical protein